MNPEDLIAVDRRKFMKIAGALAGASVLPGISQQALSTTTYVPETLSVGEMETLATLLARLFPADLQDGGAVEAGADIYIDRELGRTYTQHLPDYRAGLAAVDSLAKQEGASGPGELAPSRIDSIITRLEQGAVIEPLTDSSGNKINLANGGSTFFGLLRKHMLEGIFGDPAYGGNRGYLGWKLLGYPGIQLYYSVAEQAVNDPASTQGNRSIIDFGAEPRR